MPSIVEYLKNFPETFDRVMIGTGKEGEPTLGWRILDEALEVAKNLDYGPVSLGGAMGGALGLIKSHGPKTFANVGKTLNELHPAYARRLNTAVARGGKHKAGVAKTIGDAYGTKSFGDVDAHVFPREHVGRTLVKALDKKVSDDELVNTIHQMKNMQTRALAFTPFKESVEDAAVFVPEDALNLRGMMHELGGHVALERLRPSTLEVLGKNFTRRAPQMLEEATVAGTNYPSFTNALTDLTSPNKLRRKDAIGEILSRVLQGEVIPTGAAKHLLSQEGQGAATARYLRQTMVNRAAQSVKKRDAIP